MTREEEIKLKIEYQLYKSNSGLQMAEDDEVALRLFAAIEDIKTEIKHSTEHFVNDDGEDCFAICENDVLEIIDRHINGKESE